LSYLEIESLTVTYPSQSGDIYALKDLSLSLAEGSLTVLLGESGCGKSTALNAIAGLSTPEQGSIRIGSQVLFSCGQGRPKIHLAPNERGLGMVFQSYALWPHLSIVDNVAYPIRRKGDSLTAVEQSMAALMMVRCDHLAHRFPGELSGGQQQRIALARAIVGRPQLLLFDEPLSNLDAGLRRSLRDELSKLHQEFGFTGIYVTHDQSEALALGTNIAVMQDGKILQMGSPAQIYQSPSHAYVAQFFGANVIEGVTLTGSDTGSRIQTPFGIFKTHRVGLEPNVTVSFAPHAARIVAVDHSSASLSSVVYLGSHHDYRIESQGIEILVTQPVGHPVFAKGTQVEIEVNDDMLHIF